MDHKGGDAELLLQQLVEGVAAQVFGPCRQRGALSGVEPAELAERGDDLGLDFSEGHGG